MFITTGFTIAIAAIIGGYSLYRRGMYIPPMEFPSTSKVFLISASDKSQGVKNLLKRIGIGDFQGARISLKANYNSADPFPASTHIDTLQAIVEGLNSIGVEDVT